MLVNDFNMIEALAQAEFTIANQPLQVWAQFIQNNEADDLDTGWLAGFNWGKASNPRTLGVRLRLRRRSRRTRSSASSSIPTSAAA